MKSIGDFAENLINQELQGISEGTVVPESSTSNTTGIPAGIDISKTEVPDSFMKELLGENFHPQDTPPSDTIPEIVWDEPKPESQPQPQTLTEETAQQLLPILEEVRGLLKEMLSGAMTTTGSIGVNLAGPGKKARKPKSKKDVLKASIKERLKR